MAFCHHVHLPLAQYKDISWPALPTKRRKNITQTALVSESVTDSSLLMQEKI
jgi:hypothetical protein